MHSQLVFHLDFVLSLEEDLLKRQFISDARYRSKSWTTKQRKRSNWNRNKKCAQAGTFQEKSNKCNQCDFASSYASALRRHLKTHSGEKPNRCNQCDYASSQASDLRKHLTIHSGEKPNKCTQCEYASSRSSGLRSHLKTHSGKSKQWNQLIVTQHFKLRQPKTGPHPEATSVFTLNCLH